MNPWVLTCLFIAFGICTLVLWPIAMHPTLPIRKKLILIPLIFVVLMPGALALYVLVGVPQLGNL